MTIHLLDGEQVDRALPAPVVPLVALPDLPDSPMIGPVIEDETFPVDEHELAENDHTPEPGEPILLEFEHLAAPLDPLLLETHVRIVHHPFSLAPEERISLPAYNNNRKSPVPTDTPKREGAKWYRPFRSEADFSFAEYVARVQMSNTDIDDFLQRQRETWSIGSLISFRNYRKVRATIEKAVRTTTQVIACQPFLIISL